MLAGLDPVIIIQLSKLATPSTIAAIGRIPLLSQVPTLIDQPPIPIYLSERLTGLFVDTESKNVTIETDTETLSNGQPPDVNQKGIAAGVSINLFAKKDSVGLTLLSALIDILFDKVSSKEYSITYLHGPITVFRGVLHDFVVEVEPNTDKMSVKIELSKGTKQPTKPAAIGAVPGFTGTIPGT